MRYRSRSTDELVADVDARADDNLEDDGEDDGVTVKSKPLPGAYNASSYAPNNATNVVSYETFDLLKHPITPSTKELNDRLMKFLLPPKWLEYPAMAGDIAVPSTPGDSSDSESSTISLEHAGAVHVLINGHDNIPGSEQLEVGVYMYSETC